MFKYAIKGSGSLKFFLLPTSVLSSSRDGHPHGGKRADNSKKNYVLPCLCPAGEKLTSPLDMEYKFSIGLSQFKIHAHHWIKPGKCIHIVLDQSYTNLQPLLGMG